MRILIKNFLKIISFFLFVFVLSCSTTPHPVDPEKIQKITPQEQAELCTFARKVLMSYNEQMITKREKKLILSQEPKFTAKYLADKSGSYDFSWEVNGKTITCLGNGDMTDPEKSFKRIIVIAATVEPVKNK